MIANKKKCIKIIYWLQSIFNLPSFFCYSIFPLFSFFQYSTSHFPTTKDRPKQHKVNCLFSSWTKKV